jgi:hypothetical protein
MKRELNTWGFNWASLFLGAIISGTNLVSDIKGGTQAEGV